MSFSPEQTAKWLESLKSAGIDEASQDLRHLILAGDSIADIDAMVERRSAREPLSQILGDKPFWTLDLKVTPDVLTPRADTETLVETVLKQIESKTAKVEIADFGTGSGAILLALLAECPNASGLGIDISESALEIAKENALRNQLADRVEFRIGNWAEAIPDESLDIAVSNPPYIASAVIDTLDPEVRDYEPHLALDGGDDGLDVYRILLPELFRVLCPGGLMAVEIGYDQADTVMVLAKAAGFENPVMTRDLVGQPRIIHGFKRENRGGNTLLENE
ncbi:peptide chain release factor N(5)-glutamine methyltransferase [Hyphobacterium sp. HN65]|uniref:Release factor glutamine methyltransferase n=1 Tax=Hyphobacterium lacteum TaxID=3116575 RepID=A0ABU7LQ92_9PROT|nr:peptide chain release factor N(5)-glutamine methyltransferase [Hyphobacterium sp. HN65]MEE2526088.1 peptide chain release factor N(5)-glutamine methyltransferase [Hyphobacterium sp. HN65]